MSKSLDNHIEISATEEETTRRVMTMVTDPQRARRTDPGRPGVCNVFALHKIFTPNKLDEIHRLCTTAGIGCVEDKQQLSEGINRYLMEFRERRRELEKKRGYVEEVLAHGAERARAIARNTLDEVYERMGLAGS
jgi:tryptophanyl-tRNA synthetase